MKELSIFDFAIEIAKDDGAAQAHLDAGRPIYYSKNGIDIVRKWPDGRCEIVTIDVLGNINPKSA